MKIFYILFVLLWFDVSFANTIGSNTGLELPRYVSLKSSESNLRVGPSKNYPISIKYITEDFPLKIIEEYKDWRNVVDFENNNGWIHKSLIKGERNGIIISDYKNNIKIYNTVDGNIIGEINVGTIVYVPKCKMRWCLINVKNHQGWISKKNIWGVKDNEVYNVGLFQLLVDYFFKSLNFIHKNIK